MTSLGKPEVEREQAAAEQEPDGRHDRHGPGACEESQHEESGDTEHIENDDVLQSKGVENVEAEVRDGDHQNGLTEKGAAGQPNRGENNSRPGCSRHADSACGDRAHSFGGVLPVSLSVEDVIPGIDRAGEETERDERQPGTQIGSEVKKLSGEEQRGENKSVLDPLLRPNETNPIAQAGVDRRNLAHWHLDPGMDCVSGASD